MPASSRRIKGLSSEWESGEESSGRIAGIEAALPLSPPGAVPEALRKPPQCRPNHPNVPIQRPPVRFRLLSGQQPQQVPTRRGDQRLLLRVVQAPARKAAQAPELFEVAEGCFSPLAAN